MKTKTKFDISRIVKPGVLVEYVHNSKGQRVGVLAATMVEGDKSPRIGWGFARSKVWGVGGDPFNREFGLSVAFERIRLGRSRPYPCRYDEDVQRFCERVKAYFREIPRLPTTGEIEKLSAADAIAAL